jgi:hypothetical protein
MQTLQLHVSITGETGEANVIYDSIEQPNHLYREIVSAIKRFYSELLTERNEQMEWQSLV